MNRTFVRKLSRTIVGMMAIVALVAAPLGCSCKRCGPCCDKPCCKKAAGDSSK